MRRVALLLLLLIGPASAQKGVELATFDAEIAVPLGAVEVLRFADRIDTIKILSSGVVEAQAISDRQISLTGKGLGATILYVYDVNGRLIYSARVLVEGEGRGHRVNVHAKQNTHEYYAYYCTHVGCRRVKDELEGPPRSTTESTTTYQSPSGATSVSRTTTGR